MALEKVGVYRRWLEPIPQKDGKPIPKSQWPKKRRHCWIVRWCGTQQNKYGTLFKTRKEAEGHALDLQYRMNTGSADEPRKIMLRAFRLGDKQVMKGQGAYTTPYDHDRAFRFFEKFIGGSTVLSRIRPRHADAYVAHRLSTVPGVATVNKDICTLRRIFNLAIDPREYLPEGQNPFAKIKKMQNDLESNTVRRHPRMFGVDGTGSELLVARCALPGLWQRPSICRNTESNVERRRFCELDDRCCCQERIPTQSGLGSTKSQESHGSHVR